MTTTVVEGTSERRGIRGPARVAGAAIPAGARVEVLRFLAVYAYSPIGNDPVSRRSRRLCTAIKAADSGALTSCARAIAALIRARTDFAAVLDRHALLVPVPASAPRAAFATDVSLEIARALAQTGIGAGVRDVLARAEAVRKSATAPVGARPSVAMHFSSFEALAMPVEASTTAFVLVDDVVSRGRTLLAAACRLRERYPQIPILALALMRTLGYATGLAALTAPCAGEIRWRHGDAVRRP